MAYQVNNLLILLTIILVAAFLQNTPISLAFKFSKYKIDGYSTISDNKALVPYESSIANKFNKYKHRLNSSAKSEISRKKIGFFSKTRNISNNKKAISQIRRLINRNIHNLNARHQYL